MRGYGGVDIPVSLCVHFVSNDEIDGTEPEVFKNARGLGMRLAYCDARLLDGTTTVANAIALTLGLEHAPYDERCWVCFADDLVTLAYREAGLVLVIDNAWTILDGHSRDFYDLIEAFLTQHHHWLEQGKPCHLCLQMQPNPAIKDLVTHTAIC